MKKKCTVFMDGYIDYLEDKKREAIEKAEAKKQQEIEISWANNPNIYPEARIQREMEDAWKIHMVRDGYALKFDADRSTFLAKLAYFESALRFYPKWTRDFYLKRECTVEQKMALQSWGKYTYRFDDCYVVGFINNGPTYDVVADEIAGYFNGIEALEYARMDAHDEMKWLYWEFNRVDAVKHHKAGKRYNALLREKRHVKAIGAIANHRHFKDECEDYQYLLSPDKKFNYVRGPVVHPRQASWHDEKLQKNASKIRVVRHKAHKHVNKYKNMQKRANKRKNNKKR